MTPMPRWTRLILPALLAALLGACQSAPPAKPDSSLYLALGGKAGISHLVTGTLYQVVEDKRINHYFAKVNVERLHDRLTHQICQLSGGPCDYRGDNMKNVHAGMHLTDADFNDFVEDLIRTMEKQQIPVAAQNRLLAKLAPMHDAVVGH